jgi:small subunit ribosomal protein S1
MNANIPAPGETDDLNNAPLAAEATQPEPSIPADVSDEGVVSEAQEPLSEAAASDAPAAVEAIEDEHPDAQDAVEAVEDEHPDAQDALDEPSEAAAESQAPAPGAPVSGLKKGQVIEGTIIVTSPTSVQVDLDGKGEGVIPGRELDRMSRDTLELLQPGAKVPVYVVNPHGQDGNALVSINRALEELDWQKAEEHRQNQKVYESRVAGYNKGGLIVRFGRLRGFVPQSQIASDRRPGEQVTPEERWGEMVNQPISVKVMEVDRSRNRLILSERAASREVRESRKENLISELKVGEIRTGRVVSLVDFGAFVDIGGAEGLVHLTEISWKHVTHPKDVLRVGQEVKVEVISVDPDNKRIGLSMKRQEMDPWDAVAIDYSVGQLVQATITKLTKFGAFAQLVDAPEIEGLIHISELSDQRVNHPREVVEEGDKLTLRVVKMDVQNRRLGLSLKRVNSAEYLDLDWSSFNSQE